ncbi:probable G-protein coupled receptor 141 isoform X1 [Heteronotia binoei]|uniref:probable G-protein coupled receptor 141 isoform X1 n=1 Tax=Heteronotia binoei TaxID=13085 RepID=UPI00292EAF46|nr:probable G-protein coupled receptor 141 isoform X1 [Heteronotia binoei]
MEPTNGIWKAILITVYTVVFIGGVFGAIRISFLLVKMNTLSVTTTAVINLVVVHSLFLGTVPFRLYYYTTDKWVFGQPFCKIVSAMIHVHMYLTFLFYVFVLVIRCLIFFKWKDKLEFYRNLHAVASSLAIWILAVVIALPLIHIWYGTTGHYENATCFRFHQELKNNSVKELNYAVIAVTVAVTCTLLALQVFIILKVASRLSGSLCSHQEFRAQLKSLGFVWVIILCFLPYHFFRIYYIQQYENDSRLEMYNEIWLSITAISCLDLLSFVLSGSLSWRRGSILFSCCQTTICCIATGSPAG